MSASTSRDAASTGNAISRRADGADGADVEPPPIGWGRAVATGVGVLLVAFAVTVLGANALLTRLTGVSRTTRQYLASLYFFVTLAACAWALRRLQARGLL